MANLTVTSAHLVKGDDEHQFTLPAGVNINAGQAMRPDASTGQWVLALATTAANGFENGIAPWLAANSLPWTYSILSARPDFLLQSHGYAKK